MTDQNTINTDMSSKLATVSVVVNKHEEELRNLKVATERLVLLVNQIKIVLIFLCVAVASGNTELFDLLKKILLHQ